MRTVLDRASLQLKLVAAVMAIVAAALTGISVASVAAMQGYLLDRVDDELRSIADQLLQQVAEGRKELSLAEVFHSTTENETVRLPSPYVFETRSPTGKVQSAHPSRRDPWPRVPTAPKDLTAREREPFTVPSASDGPRWRLLVEPLPGNQFLVIGASLADADSAVERLAHLSLLIGLVVLGASAMIGIGVVWASLRPLGEIERTAAGIAAGDLSRRVPDRDPRTEVGRLARVLNMTFNQIETAFRARARSEAAVRRRREPRAAQPPDLDPRFRRAAPPRRDEYARGDRRGDAPDRGRGGPDGPAGRGPVAARPARPAPPDRMGAGGPARGGRGRARRGPRGRAGPADRAGGGHWWPTGRDGRPGTAAPGARQSGTQRPDPHPAGFPDRDPAPCGGPERRTGGRRPGPGPGP